MNCTCGAPAILYWLRDDVWQSIPGAPTNPDGHLCLQCVERALCRPLTLNDLSIANYLRTTRYMGVPFMGEYARATVLGGFRAVGIRGPETWAVPTEQPHLDGMTVGERLARQTDRPTEVLLALTQELNRYFPQP